ncbi:porin [uncultured Photobacterium sp.]|uniref:porin n=1 Tax=uncultured Photobacterium sp. TaxID=173973 RepID=UPI002620551B|nr:porin [uncultured Photobacterium sp.]
MNNKHLICGVLCLGGIAGVANAADAVTVEYPSVKIGGRIEARAENRDSEIQDLSRARVNIAGESKITDTISGIAFFEEEFKKDLNKTRYLYAGVKAEVGDGEALLVYGKTKGSMGVVTDFTDIQAFYGAVASDKFKVGKRVANSIAATYSNTTGTLFCANYASAEGTESGAFDGGYSVGLSQKIGDTGLSAGIGYAKQSAVQKKDSTQFDVALGYQVDKVYVGALYSEQTVKGKKAQGYDIATSYKIDSTYKATLGFGELHFEDGDSTRAVNADITAKLTKQFRTYVAVNFDTVNNEMQEAVGIRFDF